MSCNLSTHNSTVSYIHIYRSLLICSIAPTKRNIEVHLSYGRKYVIYCVAKLSEENCLVNMRGGAGLEGTASNYINIFIAKIIFNKVKRLHTNIYFCKCGLVVRVLGYRTEMYCTSCEVRTGFTYVM
jgi:hypothetical protein